MFLTLQSEFIIFSIFSSHPLNSISHLESLILRFENTFRAAWLHVNLILIAYNLMQFLCKTWYKNLTFSFLSSPLHSSPKYSSSSFSSSFNNQTSLFPKASIQANRAMLRTAPWSGPSKLSSSTILTALSWFHQPQVPPMQINHNEDITLLFNTLLAIIGKDGNF